MKPYYMPIVNYAKVGAIWATDLINKVYNPFKEAPDYTPESHVPNLETLAIADLEARFMTDEGEFLYQRPRPADAGDTALFQGICTGMKIMRNGLIAREINFINKLFVNGTLIRGYRNDGTPNDTTSNDAATGMLFFFYCALWYGDSSTRSQAGALLRLWLNNMYAHNWSLVDLQGKPTTYGVLDNGVMTDPLRITLLLGILSVGMAYDETWAIEYAKLYEKYKPLLKYPKVKLLWWDTDYDTHRAAIHLHVLYMMTRDDVYRDGLRRIWRITSKENNAWVYTLCSIAMEQPDGAYVGRVLSTASFNQRQLGNVETINDVPSVNWPPKLPFGLTKPKVRSQVALPLHKRGSQEFVWQRNMFSKNEWVGNKTADVYHSMLDILVCGWLASRLGLFK